MSSSQGDWDCLKWSPGLHLGITDEFDAHNLHIINKFIFMKSLQNLTIIENDMELIPNEKTLKIQEGVIGCQKYGKPYMLSFMVDKKFIEIMLSENDMLEILNYCEKKLRYESIENYKDI